MTNQYILTPFFLDQPREALRSISDADWVVNAPALPEGEMQARMSAVHKGLAGHVAQALRAGARPVSVAGDCCATIGVAAGLQRAGVEPVFWAECRWRCWPGAGNRRCPMRSV